MALVLEHTPHELATFRISAATVRDHSYGEWNHTLRKLGYTTAVRTTV